MDKETYEATMQMVASHLRKQHCTDGEVSRPFFCSMETPDGTIQMVAYKLSDSRQPDFWVAVEHLKVDEL